MFEHVGLRQYPAYFRTARRLLAPDGVMLLHSMAQPTPAPYNQPFIEKYIFPGGYIPALSEVFPAVEKAGLLVRDAEILSLHYAETTREWRRRFLANRERVLELYDERFIRMWEFYLAGSECAFRYDVIHVFHLQLALDQTRVPLTRAYIPGEWPASPRPSSPSPTMPRCTTRRSPRPRPPQRLVVTPAGLPAPPMTIFRVRHVTTYRYRRPVGFGEHQLMFRPRDSYDQRLLERRARASIPQPAAVRWIHDVFGNCVALVDDRRPRARAALRDPHPARPHAAGRARPRDRRAPR